MTAYLLEFYSRRRCLFRINLLHITIYQISGRFLYPAFGPGRYGTYIQYTTDIQYSISGTVVYTVSGLRPGIHVRSVVDPDDFCPVPDP